MSNSGGGSKSGWPSVGDLHVGVRNLFTSTGLGASTLGGVARDHPDLMKKPANFKNMSELVSVENKRVKQGPLTTPGDYVARLATPIRRAAVHGAMANATLGHYGLRGLVEDKHGYGMQVFSDITSGTF